MNAFMYKILITNQSTLFYNALEAFHAPKISHSQSILLVFTSPAHPGVERRGDTNRGRKINWANASWDSPCSRPRSRWRVHHLAS